MIVLVSTDLQARVRLESLVRPLGFEVATLRPESGLGELTPGLVVLDLDQLGTAGAALWAARVGDARTLGFFSHIDRELGATAAELGIETFRRGRFWKELPVLLASG